MKYVKPEFTVTEFALNETIATCPVDETYNQVTVNCVISGSHAIFYTQCEANYDDLTIVTYNGNEYLVWANTNSGGGSGGRSVSTYAGGPGGGSVSGSTELQAILQAGENANLLPSGGTDDASTNWQKYHAGMITPDIEKTRNSSL